MTNKTMYDQCNEHIHLYVLIQMNDGSQIDGIVTGVDKENVHLAVPIDYSQENNSYDHRVFWPGYGGFGYPGFGYPGYGRRRFNRLILPLAALTAISVLPWY
ncbi:MULTISPECIES: hypothetical protein [Oceanobacillus]|uniref:Uncharacterized protein n=1 Tax=Oceanobacillus kimchii TaxID=746691 RepID=A0ABQ5THR5_9BACI|nr:MULTISPECIES: hypothetical protein [Oceanobacillus]MBT2599041.1 hypothetical protein [Oceanobacillus sp. ISL-74]MBT2651959.1 hypothetical protein [Oceanobacillus sp. ISL-73]MCT1578704.1 hypothetical protein [Oceanobacillus kimchii]MCT2136247.1 hypothetical protein [Oceanobacillus kimchii]OEH54340.1 hypothetical protein AQ616_11300 [Oceanobacillus sp. E9]